eukprot:11515956-Prorocentrum_lima.AAC.1
MPLPHGAACASTIDRPFAYCMHQYRSTILLPLWVVMWMCAMATSPPATLLSAQQMQQQTLLEL